MPDILRRYPIVAALAAVGVLLLLVIAAEIAWGTRSLPTAASPGTATAFTEAKLLPSLASVAPEQAYPETGTRPMFTPTRRPAPQAAANSNMAKGQFVLQGVTIVGDVRIAMLRDTKANRMYRVEKGRDINGVVVAEIDPERVTLRQGDDSEVLALTVQKPGAPAAPSTLPAGPFASAPLPPPAAPPAAMAQPSGVPPPAQSEGSQGGFGPPRPAPARPPGGAAAQQNDGGTAQSANATAEELLARRRARRQGQQ